MKQTQTRLDTITLYGVMLLTAMTGTMIGAATPALTERLGLTYSQVGLLGSAQGIGGIVAIALGGALSDRFSKTRIVLVSFIAYALAAGAIGLCGGYALLLGDVLLVCMLSNLLSLVISAYFTEQENGEGRLSIGHAMFSLGSLLGPLWVTCCLGLGGGSVAAFLAVGGVCLAFCAPCLKLASSAPAAQASDGGSLALLLRKPAIRLLGLACVFFMGQQTALSAMGASYFVDRWQSVHGEWMLTLYWLGVMAGRFLQPWIDKHVAPTRYLACTCALFSAALAVALWVDSEALLLAILTLCAVGTGAAFPTMIALGSQASEHHAGMATTLICLAGTIGGMITPALVGWLSQRFDSRIGMLLVPLSLLCCAICLIGASQRKPK